MKDIFTFLMVNLHRLGDLKKANMYETSCNIVYESNGKVYDIFITCNEKKEEQ